MDIEKQWIGDNMILIVDYSKWQSRVNPNKLMAFGVSAAIVKCGEVWINYTDKPATDDAQYDNNMVALRDAELPHGSYYYYHPSAGNSKQLRHYQSLWERHEHDFPPVLDVEDTDGLNPYEVQRQVKVMLEGMEEISGRKPIIYTRNGFWVNQVGNPLWSDDYQFWLAQYPKLTNKSVKNIIMHQFTDKLAVPGCPAMDGNYWIGTDYDFYEMVRPHGGSMPSIEHIKNNRIKKRIFVLSRANRMWLENQMR